VRRRPGDGHAVVRHDGAPGGEGTRALADAFEVGLFTWMALMFWVFFPDPHLEPDTASSWFLMQVGMTIGYFTSYPMNVVLIHKGIKEAM
jgi:hypothetical protein